MTQRTSHKPETSIIIRTFNEEKYLPLLLDSLQNQLYREFEIVVVDSGSLDRTREIAAAHTSKLLRINSHDFTFGYSLNVGIQAASGIYAVIVSAHTLPVDDTWLGSLVAAMADGATAMSYGSQRGWKTSKFSECQDLLRTFGPRRKVQRPPDYFAHNANSAIRKELWQQHPFDESLPGLEDIEWAKHWMERGHQVVYEPEAAMYHIHEETWRQVKRRYYREGLAARWIGIKGRRHLLSEAVREAAAMLVDLGLAVRAKPSAPPAAVGALERCGEVVLFRFNKALGTVRGLLDGATMSDPAAREAMFFDRQGQAVVIEAPGRASIQQVPIPDVKPGDVLIRTAYSGVTGAELELFDGTLPGNQNGKVKYPVVPGHELSGWVAAVGPNVTHVRVNELVVVVDVRSCGACAECLRSNQAACQSCTGLGTNGKNGGYARHVVVSGRFVHPLPAGLDLRRAALCQPLAETLKGLNQLARSWPPEPSLKRCAVVGAGSVGHLCARVLAHKGHEVTSFDRDARRRSNFHGSSIKTSDDLSQLAGFDILVEASGDAGALDAVIRRSPPGATVLVMGQLNTQHQLSIRDITAFDKTVVGSAGSGSQEYEEALRLLPYLNLNAYLQCVLPLDQYQQAWEFVRQGTHLKVLLYPKGDLS